MRRILAYILVTLPLLLMAPAINVQASAATPKAKTSQTRAGKKKSAQKKKKAAPRTADQVKQDRQNNARQMRETRRQITLNTRETEQRLNQLNLLEGEIAECNTGISRQTAQLDRINSRITATSDSIIQLDNRLKAITDRYITAIRRSQGHRRQTSELAFIFSSDSFSQAWRRLRSLKQFNRWRDRRSREIASVKEQLDGRRKALATLREQAARQLEELNGSRTTLLRKQSETNVLLERLRSEGGELKQIMAQRQKEAASLDAELDRIIAEEARRQEELRLKKEAEERKAREEAERKARIAEEERIAREAREAEEAKKAEAQRIAAEKKAEQARLLAEQQKQAEAQAKTEAEKQAARQARKEAQAEEKKQKEAAAKAEKERIRAEKEAAKKAREEARKRAKEGKPVRHSGKNNGRGDTGAPASSAAAPKLNSHLSGGVDGIASAAAIPSGVDFNTAKGKLPFPVEGRYTIVKRFGRQKHPTLPHVETNNSGIDIATARGAAVHAVFDGEVSAVFRPDGYNNVIVIRHGRYMTVYANLGAITVSTGQKVKAGQSLGTLYADPDDSDARSVLHFEIRNQRQKENPELWLRH